MLVFPKIPQNTHRGWVLHEDAVEAFSVLAKKPRRGNPLGSRGDPMMKTHKMIDTAILLVQGVFNRS